MLVQHSKSLLCWLRSDPCMHSLEASPGVPNKFYEVTFLSFSLSMIFLLFSGSLGPFCPPVRNLGLYLPYFATCFYKCAHVWGQGLERQGEKKQWRFTSFFWDHNSTNHRERSPLSEFWFLWDSVATRQLFGSWSVRERGKKEKIWGISVLSLSIRSFLS